MSVVQQKVERKDGAERRQRARVGEVRKLRARDDFDRDVWSVLGMPIDRATPPSAVDAIRLAARDNERLSIVTPNVNFLVRTHTDSAERRAILNADLSLADGAPIALLARILGLRDAERVAGADVFEALRRDAAFSSRRLSVFFFGGRDGAARAAAEKITAENRGLISAGYLNPGHGDLDSMSTEGIIGEINTADPDFIIVSLGASKGQAWIERNKDRLNAPVISHLGAVVDFTAGTISRAPTAWRRMGLEWAWRIKEEPSLATRYWRDGRALISILATRLGPALLSGRVKRVNEPAAAQITPRGGATEIRLSGDLVDGALDSVRRSFRGAALAGEPVILEFAKAGAIDAAFLGQVLMLEKALGRVEKPIKVRGGEKKLRRLLAAHGLVYEEAGSASPNESEAVPGIAAAG